MENNCNGKITPFQFYCQHVLPLVYDQSLSYYEVLCKLQSKLNEVIESQNNLNDSFQQLLTWVDTQLEIYAKEQLENWKNDGTLESIINQEIFSKLNEQVAQNTTAIKKDRIYSETDFETYKDSDCWELMNDITITQPILQFQGDKSFDLNGYTITLSDDYTENYIFKLGFDNDFQTEARYLKMLFNGQIDCNDKDCSVFHIALAWRLWLHHLKVRNCVRGLTSYAEEPNGTYGAECNFNCVSVYHSMNSNDDYNGLLIRMTDSVFNSVNPVFFKYGIVVRAGANVLENCHPWGYPKTTSNTYPLGTFMKIGITVFSSNNKIVNCIADTFEPLDTAQDPSYDNGGIGIYVCGYDIDVINCYTITHRDTLYMKHIGYYFADTNPESQSPKYLARCSITNCHVNVVSKTPFAYQQPCESELPIQMIANGFDKVRSNDTNYSVNNFLSGSTYFENNYDRETEYSYYMYLPNPLSHKFMVNGNTIHGILTEADNTKRQCYIQPYRNFYCTSLSALQTLANTIITEQNKYNGFYTSYPYTAMLYVSGNCKLVVWNSATKKFYYVGSGEEVTYA